MTARFLVLAVAVCAMPFAAGCVAPVEMAGEQIFTPTEDKLTGWGLPVAPAPRAKKTTAELLVGTWREIERDGDPTPKEWVYLDTFTADGQCHLFADQPPGPALKPQPERWSGTYSVAGNTVRYRIKHEDGDVLVGVMTITEINGARLSYTARGGFENQRIITNRYVFRREPKKG